VPEYSPCLPATLARQAPFHCVAAFAADQPPLATVLPCASVSVHIPVTVLPVESRTAVHVPISGAPLAVVALHVPDRLFCAVAAESLRATPCALDARTAAKKRSDRKNDVTRRGRVNGPLLSAGVSKSPNERLDCVRRRCRGSFTARVCEHGDSKIARWLNYGDRIESTITSDVHARGRSVKIL
jgi:hypothetical protein